MEEIIMIRHSDHFHGSDLETIEKIYGKKKEDIVSFSANVNPLGISSKLRVTLSDQLDSIMSYPDRDYTSLRVYISEYLHTDPDNIIVGNGSTELISLFIQIKHPKKALIVGPTYSEYEREVSLGGGHTFYYRLDEDKNFALDISNLEKDLTYDVDLLAICNPNNPTSSAITKSEMRRILDICKQKGIFVMVDETYVEFAENVSEISSVPLTNYYNNIIILRGISKFFAAPGLRLGYAVCGNMDLLKEINQRKNPWTINSLAAVAGEIMFTDADYIKQTRTLISKERTRICRILDTCDQVKYYPPTANFILLKILKEKVSSMDLFETAIRKGYMIRDCSTFPFLNNKFIRFCFMMPELNDALLKYILELLVYFCYFLLYRLLYSYAIIELIRCLNIFPCTKVCEPMKQTDLKSLIEVFSRIAKSIHQLSYSNQGNQKMYPGQRRLLCLLKEHEGLTQIELAKMHFVKPSTITGMLTKLEANHFVYRVPDKTDKRNMRVYLTPEGKDLAKRGEAFMTALAQRMFDNFSNEDLQTYLTLTKKISDNLKDIHEKL
jgi:threonine-phosphate decarboxylase